MFLIQCHSNYACSIWCMGISKLLKKDFKLHKIRLSDSFLKWIQGLMQVLMNSSPLAGCKFHVELIKSFYTMFLKSNPQSAHYMTENFIQEVHYIHMVLGLGKVGTFLFLKWNVLAKNYFFLQRILLSHIKEKQSSICDFKITVKKRI